MIRKFYDTGAADKGGDTKFKLGEAFSFESVDNTLVEEKEETADDKQEEKVEEKTEENVEKKEEKPDEKVEEKKEEIKAPITQDWREFVKKPEHKKEIFQLLDIDEDSLNLSKDLKNDEFLKKAVIFRKEHGNLTPFIEAATRDYDKVTPEQLIMEDLKKQYSHLSSEKADKLAKVDFNQRFSYKEDPNLTDEENAEIAELTALKLESEGEKLRQAKKAEQKSFLDSVKPVDRTADAQKLADEQAKKTQDEFQKFAAMYDADPASIKLNAEKKIVLGKEKPFNYTVNPATIKEQTLDISKFYGKFWSEKNGELVFNTDKWNRVVAYSENQEAFEEGLINHGISQGTKDLVENELENVKEKTDPKPGIKKESLAKAVAKGQPFSFNGT